MDEMVGFRRPTSLRIFSHGVIGKIIGPGVSGVSRMSKMCFFA